MARRKTKIETSCSELENLISSHKAKRKDGGLGKEAVAKLRTVVKELQIESAKIGTENTALKRAGQKAEEERDRYQDLFQFAPDPYFVTSTEGVIQEANEAAGQLLGLQPKKLIGLGLETFMPKLDHSTFFIEMRRVNKPAADMKAEWETTMLNSSGTRISVSLSGAKVEDLTKKKKELRWIARDITLKKQADLQVVERARDLARANLELEQFANAAAHDLQEPLRVVSTFAQLLEQSSKERLNPEELSYMAHIIGSSNRMLSLVRDLLIYSKSGTAELESHPVDCNAIARNAVKEIAISLKETKGKVSISDLPTIMGHDSQVLQLFINLIGNAIKFHGENAPRVRVSAEVSEDGTEWIFCVADNGIGIADEYASRIFGMFQRLHSQSEYPGNGIGLAICKKIVERMGGRIWLSSGKGSGSTFFFSMPRLSETSSRQTKSPRAKSAHTRSSKAV